MEANEKQPDLTGESGAESAPESENLAPEPNEPEKHKPIFLSKQCGDDPFREEKEKSTRPFSVGIWASLTVICVCIAVLLTFTLTSAAERKNYRQALEDLRVNTANAPTATVDAENLKILEGVLANQSLYADTLDAEAMLQAAFKAYVAASGDRYAVLYTEEEFNAMREETAGQYVGIGVHIEDEDFTVGDETHKVFRIVSVDVGSPAEQAGVRANDRFYAVETAEGSWKLISALGHSGAVTAIRGEKGTTVRIKLFRQNGERYDDLTVTCERKRIDVISAEGRILEQDPTVGVIRMTSFDLNTPVQFRKAVDDCIAGGATRFVFDVRGNPGGDLRSIQAVLSGFLREGDLILRAVDKNGRTAQETRCEVVSNSGDAEGCNVTKQQIGMYRDLNFVILCDQDTASAAEVFTATLRDFGLTKAIVGKTTFGKGILQSIFEIPFKEMIGYIKLTTHSYVTECGESYHGIGIAPTVEADRKAGTESTDISRLSWDDDNQLQAAVRALNA